LNFQAFINQNIDKNIYNIVGDEYLCNQAKNHIISNLNLDESSISYFDGENFNIIDIENACNQFSFFDNKRLVLIKNITKELNQSEKKWFSSYEKNINTSAILVFVQCGNVFDFLTTSENIDCKANENYNVNFIINKFKQNDKTIDFATAKVLNDVCLGDLIKIEIEINKILSYLKDDKVVNKELIDSLVHKNIEFKIFDLTDAIGRKNKNKTLSLMKVMLENGESVQMVLSLLFGQYKRMLFAKISKNENLAKMLQNPISKSGANHRIVKIMQLAEEHKKERGEI